MSLVLLIDDEPEMADLVRMCIEGAGLRLAASGNAGQAVEAARRERPAVVLLDLALGAQNGLDLLPALRAEPALAGVPIVAFTIHASERAEALRRGVDGFVTKPFRANALLEALEPYVR